MNRLQRMGLILFLMAALSRIDWIILGRTDNFWFTFYSIQIVIGVIMYWWGEYKIESG